MTLRFKDQAEFDQFIALGRGAQAAVDQLTKPLKYNNKPQSVDGLRFPSKHHAKYYAELVLLRKSGAVNYFLREVPFDLPGGVKVRIDFQVFWADGTVTYDDPKGKRTDQWIRNKKQVEALYKITIREV